jgi:RNA polymerase sigma factor (sigma-70 family)
MVVYTACLQSPPATELSCPPQLVYHGSDSGGHRNAITLIGLMEADASLARLKLVGAEAPALATVTFLASPVYGPEAALVNCLIAPAAFPSLFENSPERPGPHNRLRTEYVGAELFRGVQDYLVARRNHVPSTAVLSDAWHRFYSRYAPFIRQVVLSFGVQSTDLDDCTQEVWNELTSVLPTAEYDPARGPFQNWLQVIVRRKVGEYLNEGRRVRLDGSDEGLRDIACCRVPPPDVSAERREVCETVYSALQAFRQRVSVTNYLILEMHWLDEIPLVEVADRLGLYHEQVWARHRRVLRRFRRFLEARPKPARVFWRNSGKFPKIRAQRD